MKRQVFLALFLLLSLMVLVSCDEADSGCVSGEYQECPCGGDETGIQQCEDDSTWADCECGGDSDTDTDTDTDSDTDTDTDSDTDSDTDTDSDAPDCADGHGKLDVNTNICWQHPEANGNYEWQDAMDYCDALTLGGHDDWHLPSGEEYTEMLGDCDDDILINEGHCNSCDNSVACSAMFGLDDLGIYWSSSLYGSNFAWYVYFYEGWINYYYLDYDILVRCVRQEQ